MGTWSYSIAGDTDRHQFQARCLCESRYAGETATKHIEFNSVGNAGRDFSFLKQETNIRGVDLIGVLFKGIVYYIISFKNHGYFQHITTQITCRNNRCRVFLLVYLPVQRRNRLKHTNYVLESLLLLYLAQIRDSFQIGSVSEGISCSLLNIDDFFLNIYTYLIHHFHYLDMAQSHKDLQPPSVETSKAQWQRPTIHHTKTETH